MSQIPAELKAEILRLARTLSRARCPACLRAPHRQAQAGTGERKIDGSEDFLVSLCLCGSSAVGPIPRSAGQQNAPGIFTPALDFFKAINMV